MDKYHVQSKKEGRIAGSEQSGEEGKVCSLTEDFGVLSFLI